MPLEQWFMATIVAKIEVEKTRYLLQSYAQKADYVRFDTILDRVPDVLPVEGDEL
ncbi:MAG: hypothetical protein AAF152_21265 [Cyanobacteria bacterium P01_A01_bin.114]